MNRNPFQNLSANVYGSITNNEETKDENPLYDLHDYSFMTKMREISKISESKEPIHTSKKLCLYSSSKSLQCYTKASNAALGNSLHMNVSAVHPKKIEKRNKRKHLPHKFLTPPTPLTPSFPSSSRLTYSEHCNTNEFPQDDSLVSNRQLTQ